MWTFVSCSLAIFSILSSINIKLVQLGKETIVILLNRNQCNVVTNVIICRNVDRINILPIRGNVTNIIIIVIITIIINICHNGSEANGNVKCAKRSSRLSCVNGILARTRQ